MGTRTGQRPEAREAFEPEQGRSGKTSAAADVFSGAGLHVGQEEVGKDYYEQRPLFDPDTRAVLTAAATETLGARARLHNPRYSTAAGALMAARIAGSAYGLRRFDVGLLWTVTELMGGKDVEGLGCPAIDDTAQQLGDALDASPGTVRNALARLGGAGLVGHCFGWVRYDGDRRWFVPGNRTRGRRVLMPGVVLCAVADEVAAAESHPRAPAHARDNAAAPSSSPPSVTSSSPPSVTHPRRTTPEGPITTGLKADRVESGRGPVDAFKGPREDRARGSTRVISDSCCGRRRTRPSAPPAPPLPRTRGTGPGPRSRPAH